MIYGWSDACWCLLVPISGVFASFVLEVWNQRAPAKSPGQAWLIQAWLIDREPIRPSDSEVQISIRLEFERWGYK